MNTSPARSLRAIGGSTASGRTPVRIARSVVFWTVTAMAAVAALLPIRPESVTAAMTPAQSSVTFSGYDLAAFQELGIDVQGSVAGTLRVVPMDLAVGEDGVREEVTFGTTDFSLAQGLRVTPESFDYEPGDTAQRFGFTVVVDPATIDRTRVAALRFVFQPDVDGARVETVTVPVVAVPVVEGEEDADPVGPPAGNVELISVDVRQDGAWTLVDRLLPDLPSVVGHAPGVATAELFGNTVHIMSGAHIEIAYDRVNPLSLLPFIDDDGSTEFRTTVDEGFLLPRERASVSAGSFGAFTGSAPREALPFIGIVRVTATATRDIAGAEQVVESKTRTIVVVPWTEMLFIAALGSALRRRRGLLVRRDQERFLREGPRVLLGGRGRRGEATAPGVEPQAPSLEPAAFGSATFRPTVVPPLEEAGVGAFREPVADEPHMPVEWEQPAGDIAAMRARQRAAEELAAATAARRAAVGTGLSRAASGAWPWIVAVLATVSRSVWRVAVAVVNGVASVADVLVVRTARRVPVVARRVGSAFSSGTAALDRRLTASATAVGRGATASTSVAARGLVRVVSSVGAAAINGVSAVVRALVWTLVTLASGVGTSVRAVSRAIAFAVVSVARGATWMGARLGRGVAVSAVATSSAIASGSRDAVRAFAHWRRTGGRDLRLILFGYLRALRRNAVLVLVLAYDGIWWIGRGTEIGLDLGWKALRRGAVASARGAAVLGRGGLRVGGAALRGSTGLLRAATGLIRASGRASGAALRTSAQVSARASAAAAQATGHGLTAVGSAVGAGTAVVARTTRERIVAFASTVGRAIVTFARSVGHAIVVSSRAFGRASLVSARVAGRASLVSGRAIGRASLVSARTVGHLFVVSARATGRGLVSVSRLTARGAVIAASATSSGASHAWSSYRWWARTNVPAIRRWFSAWGRLLRRNAIVSARGLGRATVVAARGLVTFLSVTARLLGRATVAIGRATIAAASATGVGASSAWSAYRVWLRTDYPAIRRWFAAWGRLFRRNAIAFGRVVIAVLAWSGERLDDLFHATAVGARRLARWWVRSGAPGLAYSSRRLWRRSRHLARVSAIGTSRWLAGKRRQSVRGWARAKRWTRITLRFIARVARATWAGPLRWFLRILLRLAVRGMKWLDRRNDDLPPLD